MALVRVALNILLDEKPLLLVKSGSLHKQVTGKLNLHPKWFKIIS